MSNLIAWSWTRLQDFETCPYKFWGKHISKIFITDWNSPAILHGREVHNMFEDAIKRGNGGHISPTYAWLMPLIKALIKQKATAEKKITFNSHDKDVAYFADDAYMRCGLDVIVSDKKPNHWIILDWKTGKVRPDSQGQLRLYACVLFQHDPKVEFITVGYIWADHPEARPTIETYERKDYPRLWEQFHERASRIQDANRAGNWPKIKNRFCSWCPATTLQCEHQKVDK